MSSGTASCNNITANDTRALYFNIIRDGGPAKPVVKVPAVNITETDTEYHIVVAAPGLRREDFYVKIREGIISISAKSQEVELNIHDRWEYDLSTWTRKFRLPEDADALLTQASHKNGELLIRMPRNTATDNKVSLTVYVY